MDANEAPLWTPRRVQDTLPALAPLTAEQVVAWTLGTFGPRTVIACSFSREDIALVHLAAASGLPCRVLALDTGRLHEETLAVAALVAERYGVDIEWKVPGADDLEGLLDRHGPFSFRSSLVARRRCCEVRKVRPLRKGLADAPAWLTGLRRGQGETRSGLPILAWDETFGGLVKVSPLAGWSDEQLAAFARAQALPENGLYGHGFTSIGCAPCTRPPRPGEHSRAGRWWWEDPEHSECGLHLSRTEETLGG